MREGEKGFVGTFKDIDCEEKGNVSTQYRMLGLGFND
jgi:hypothetical protein